MNVTEEKQTLRQLASQRRTKISDRAEKSLRIGRRVLEQPWMATADPVSCYVSFHAEVETHGLIRRLLQEGRRVCVPWCDGDDLRLTRIDALEELKPRTIGLLEPGRDLRQDASRTIDPADVAVFLVPGLAFTRDGDRIGYGRGYYDRMLSTVVSGITAGLAFDAQIVDAMPITALDVRLDYVVTEERVYTARD